MFKWLKSLIKLTVAWHSDRAELVSSGQLAKGIPKPTTTLAHLLVSEMLRNLDTQAEITYAPNIDDPRRPKWDQINYQAIVFFPSFEARGNITTHRRHSKGDKLSLPCGLKGISFHVDGITFDDDEIEILNKGLAEFGRLGAEKRKHEEETSRQDKAVEAIAKFMGISEQDAAEYSEVA